MTSNGGKGAVCVDQGGEGEANNASRARSKSQQKGYEISRLAPLPVDSQQPNDNSPGVRPHESRRTVPGLLFLLLALTWLRANPSTAAATPLIFTVTPTAAGEQFIRTSLPFPLGLLGTHATPQVLAVSSSATQTITSMAFRILSLHPTDPQSTPTVRRGLVSFLHTFPDLSPARFELRAAPPDTPAPLPSAVPQSGEPPVSCSLQPDGVQLRWTDGTHLDLTLIAPPLSTQAEATREQPRLEDVENSPLFRWQRFHIPDPHWPRVIEIRIDRQGTVAVSAHLQRVNTNGVFAPDFGWDLQPRDTRPLVFVSPPPTTTLPPKTHAFASGTEATVRIGETLELSAPTGAASRRGYLELATHASEPTICRYRRCLASESVPMQSKAWRRADLVISRPGIAVPTATLSSPHRVEIDSRLWAMLYGMPAAPQGLPHELESLLRYHRLAIARSAAQGDDLGNVTGFNDGQEHGGAFGMNRLNHGAAIFEDAWRSADARLRETAMQWCNNFHDLSIWWGDHERGGTRYNNIIAQNRTPPTTDFMWRSDSSVNFCTKGYDCFWLAWEETGDPRMREALDAQLDYAARHLHANVECRNIGDVRDFVRLYEFTGQRRHLDEALRLFRELRAKLSTGHLFDQGGKPLDPNPPFINDDQTGLKVGYAKPYIIGYALNGLPALLRYARTNQTCARPSAPSPIFSPAASIRSAAGAIPIPAPPTPSCPRASNMPGN
jgi:hypothetical protein